MLGGEQSGPICYTGNMSNWGESGQPYRRRALFDCAAALSNYSLVFKPTTRLPLNQPPLKILSLAIMATEKKEKMEGESCSPPKLLCR